MVIVYKNPFFHVGMNFGIGLGHVICFFFFVLVCFLFLFLGVHLKEVKL